MMTKNFIIYSLKMKKDTLLVLIYISQKVQPKQNFKINFIIKMIKKLITIRINNSIIIYFKSKMIKLILKIHINNKINFLNSKIYNFYSKHNKNLQKQ